MGTVIKKYFVYQFVHSYDSVKIVWYPQILLLLLMVWIIIFIRTFTSIYGFKSVFNTVINILGCRRYITGRSRRTKRWNMPCSIIRTGWIVGARWQLGIQDVPDIILGLEHELPPIWCVEEMMDWRVGGKAEDDVWQDGEYDTQSEEGSRAWQKGKKWMGIG